MLQFEFRTHPELHILLKSRRGNPRHLCPTPLFVEFSSPSAPLPLEVEVSIHFYFFTKWIFLWWRKRTFAPCGKSVHAMKHLPNKSFRLRQLRLQDIKVHAPKTCTMSAFMSWKHPWFCPICISLLVRINKQKFNCCGWTTEIFPGIMLQKFQHLIH